MILQSGQHPQRARGVHPDPYGNRRPRADYYHRSADSGFQGISGVPGGTGLALGAEFGLHRTEAWSTGRPGSRAGAPSEPGHWEGGIWFSNQIPFSGFPSGRQIDPNGVRNFSTGYAQDDPIVDYLCPPDQFPCPTLDQLYPVEPWWPERYSDRNTVKPQRSGFEVHDLVLTYSTNNLYAKETFIQMGQGFGNDAPFTYYGGGKAGDSYWNDPSLAGVDPITGAFDGASLFSVGILESRFNSFFSLGGFQDITDGITSTGHSVAGRGGLLADDTLTSSQYSFETVPFKLSGDAIDARLNDPRSVFFPNPPQQPTLPATTRGRRLTRG